MKNAMRVKLTDIEVRLAKTLAHARHENNVAYGVKSKKVANKDWQTEESIHENGMAGEIAFAKVFNLYPDTFIGGRQDIDFFLPDGRTVDVKTTTYRTGRLLARKLNGADIYVLVTGKIPNFKIVGWATAEELKTGKMKLGFSLAQKDLHPISELLSDELMRYLHETGEKNYIDGVSSL